MKSVTCTITVSEVDGKLAIFASIPDHAEKTVAAALTKALIDASTGIMNAVLDENKAPERVQSH